MTTAGSAALAFMLGLRHGLDADHLAAIDGLTRWNTTARRPFAAHCGSLFAAGHAAVILCATVGFSLLAREWQPPEQLAWTGALLSAGSLLLLSLVNLRLAFRPATGEACRPMGWRSKLFGSLMRAPHSWQVVLLGALFALSFDAMAIAGIFAASSRHAVVDSAGLALLFGLGMACIGTANGLWIARLARHSDAAHLRASRIMMLSIALTSLLVAGGVLLILAFPGFDAWIAERELPVSASVITAILTGYFIALFFVRRDLQPLPDASPHPGKLSCAD